MRFYCTSTGPIGGPNCEVSTILQLVPQVVSVVRLYCTSTGPIGGLNCEVLVYFNWSHRWSQL